MKKTLGIVAFTACFMATQAYATTNWNVSLWGKRRAFTENVEKLAELVDKKTDGEFRLNISYGGLSKSRENLDGIAIGSFEMAQFCAFYHKKKNPTITVSELPFASDVSLERMAEISSSIYKHPTVVKDLARWNAMLLMPTPLPQYNIVSTSQPLEALSDFSGLRIRGPGGTLDVLQKLEANKAGVPFSEVRQAMDSGVIDAAAFAPHAHLATNTLKVGKWVTRNLNLGSADCPVVVNRDAFHFLKPEFKKALLGSVDEALAYYIRNYETKTIARFESAIEKQKVKQVTFTPAQVEQLDRLAGEVRKEWVETHKDEFDAQQLYDFTADLFSK